MTDLPTLPTLDFSNEEALQASADTRAAVALQAADSPMYFKGMALRLTISIKSLFFMLQRLDGIADNAGDRHERDAVILLYLASQPASSWSEPQKVGKHLLQPLRSRPSDWLAAIDEWADKTLTCSDIFDACIVVDQLWDLHHATRPAIDNPESETALGNGMPTQPGKSD